MKLTSNLWVIVALAISIIIFESCDEEELSVRESLEAKFEHNKTNLNSNIETIFSDVSIGNVTRRKWEFTNASISTSDKISPSIIFLEYGLVQVNLIVYDDQKNQSDTSNQEFIVYPGNNLVAYFPLDSTAVDESGNEFHGTITGTEMYNDVNGNINAARKFIDYTDYITTSAKISEQLSEGVTFSAWIKPLDTIDIGAIISNVASSSATNNSPNPNSNGAGFRFTYGTYDYRGVGLYQISSEEDKNFRESDEHHQIVVNEWAHVLGTWNGKVKPNEFEIKIYINSIETNTSGGSTFPNNYEDYINSNDLLVIGSKYLRNNFNCAIDEVRIYSRVLDVNEIQFLQKHKQ